MSLLADVTGTLEDGNLTCALIGAGAMAAHGIARSTMDIDLLIVDAAALDSSVWDVLRNSGAKVDVRRGDYDDPLVGVVRVVRAGEMPVDVVIGRDGWQRRAIERAPKVDIDGARIRIVTPLDLALLKLYAGAPKDLWDVQSLLALPGQAGLRERVDAALVDLPLDCRKAWRSVLEAMR